MPTTTRTAAAFLVAAVASMVTDLAARVEDVEVSRPVAVVVQAVAAVGPNQPTHKRILHTKRYDFFIHPYLRASDS